MNKFKVGERYIARDGGERVSVIEVTNIEGYQVNYATVKGCNPCRRDWFYSEGSFASKLKPLETNKIVITTDGITTTAKLYKDDNTIKTATAKCSSDDTFDFSKGAKIAFDRLINGTSSKVDDIGKSKDKSFDWETFKKEKIAVHCDTEEKAEAFLKEAHERGFKWTSGDSLLIRSYWKDYGSETCYTSPVRFSPRDFYLQNFYTIVEYPFAEQETKEEPQKLYCVKAYYNKFTKGKIYTFENGYMTYDNGRGVNRYASVNDYLECYADITDYLVPLVSRPAKDGEWVYVLNESDSFYEPRKIYKVYETGTNNCVWFANDKKGNIQLKDYLVLDGYKEQP